jgi:hypothetical protein
VVGLIHAGAGAAQVANATTAAAERWFTKAADDPGVVETVWLLMRLPLAAWMDRELREVFGLVRSKLEETAEEPQAGD